MRLYLFQAGGIKKFEKARELKGLSKYREAPSTNGYRLKGCSISTVGT